MFFQKIKYLLKKYFVVNSFNIFDFYLIMKKTEYLLFVLNYIIKFKYFEMNK